MPEKPNIIFLFEGFFSPMLIHYKQAKYVISEDIGRTGRDRSRLTSYLRLSLGGWRSRFQLLEHSDKAESGATVPKGVCIQGDYA